MNSLCVYCGSSTGTEPAYARAARELGSLLASRKITLVYGGGSNGLMGVTADAVLAGGGHAIGVIPQLLLDKEVGHRGLPDLRIVQTMHERKAEMADLADAFVAMPGGVGTLEELFEAITWNQLGYHSKPVGILNVDGYFDLLLEFIENAVRRGFLRRSQIDGMLVDSDPVSMLDRLAQRCVTLARTHPPGEHKIKL